MLENKFVTLTIVSELFGALLAYRGIYYFLPLIIAVMLLSVSEIRQKLVYMHIK
jgi:uncharacterized membrane protein YbhN (UPF0104 family)